MTRGSAPAYPQPHDYGIDPVGGCALANLRSGIDPIGTATPFDDLFLLQIAPPWPSIALQAESVPAGLQAALASIVRGGRRTYALLIDADDAPSAPPGKLRFVHVRRRPGPARRLERREYLVAPQDAPASFASLALGEGPGSAVETEGFAGRELLVCTHGSRDGCCGSFGEGAHRYIRDHHAGPDLRVWRVSHFGGHRFAPTLIDMPDGRSWGWLSVPKIDALIAREEPAAKLLAGYRGWCAIPNELQVAERDLFLAYGWYWLEAELEGAVTDSGNASGQAWSMRYRLPGEEKVVRQATLRRLPETTEAPASCGAQPSKFARYSCTWYQ